MPSPMKSLLKAAEVCAECGFGLTTLYEKLKVGGPYWDPSFPRPVRVGKRLTLWHHQEVIAWLASRERA